MEAGLVLISIPLDVLMLAFVALFLYYGARPLAQFIGYGLAAVVSYVPGIGGDLANAIRDGVDSFANYVQNTLSGLWDAATQPIINLFDTAAGNLRHGAYSARQTLGTLALAFEYLMTQTLGSVTGGLANYAKQVGTSVAEWVAGEINAAKADVINWSSTAYTNLAGWMSDAVTNVWNLAHGTATELNRFEQAADDAIAQAQANAVGYAQQLYTQATQYTESEVNSATTHLSSEMVGMFNQLAGSVVTAEEWANQRINETGNLLDGHIAQVLALATTVILPRVASLENDFEECLAPMCNSGPNVMGLLDKLKGVVEAGALFLFIAEAARDPQGTANAVQSVLRPIEQTTRDGVSALTGIKL